MEAWRTTCPGLIIWEDAIADGLVCSKALIPTAFRSDSLAIPLSMLS